MLDWKKLAIRANQDPEFQLSSRHWNATLRFEVDDHANTMRIEEGVIVDVQPGAPDAQADFFVRAPRADWEQLLAPTPRPFYQDVSGAAIHHDVEIPTDQQGYAAYYPAIRRLIQLMSATRHEAN